MDKLTAARRLGVAAYTIESLEPGPDGWLATVRDMATHQRTPRLVPGTAPVDAEPIAEAKPAAAAKPRKQAKPKAAD